MNSSQQTSSHDDRPAVIILHGLGRSSRMMRPLERKLQKTFRCFNWDYPSLSLQIPELAKGLLSRLHTERLTNERRLYFAAHSMGGVLVRTLYGLYGEQLPPGSLVAMGSPLGGASVAKVLWRFPPARWIFGPALHDLANAQWLEQSAPKLRLHSLAGEIGRWDQINPFIKRPHDLLVTQQETKISELISHRTLRASHAVQPFHRSFMAEVESILRAEVAIERQEG